MTDTPSGLKTRDVGVAVEGEDLVSLFLFLGGHEERLDGRLEALTGRIRAALYEVLTIEEMERLESRARRAER